jgi:hypothetical protein
MPNRIQLLVSTLAILAAVPARPQEAPTGAPPAAVTGAPAVAATPAPTAAAPVAPPARGEGGEEQGGTGRVVGGHVFMPAAVVPGALLTTSAGSALRFGAGTTTATLTVGDRTFDGTMEYAGVGGILAFEVEFLRYFSARVHLDEMLYSGITGRSAVVVGTTGEVGTGIGVTAGLPLGSSARIGLLFDVNSGPNAGLNIATGIRNIIDACQTTGCDVPPSPFFEQVNVTAYQPALALNWAPARSLGVTANVGYEWATASSSRGGYSGEAVNLGLAVDFDFAAISSVPIGLQAQFHWQAPTTGDGLQHVTDAGGGVFYTGREHLAVGLQLYDRRFAVSPNVNVSFSTWLGEAGLRYYW